MIRIIDKRLGRSRDLEKPFEGERNSEIIVKIASTAPSLLIFDVFGDFLWRY